MSSALEDYTETCERNANKKTTGYTILVKEKLMDPIILAMTDPCQRIVAIANIWKGLTPEQRNHYNQLANEYNSNKKTVVMISGHTDLSETEWNTFYKDKIDKYISEGASFVVGGAKGADTLSQEYLGMFDNVEVTVYDKGTQKNVVCPRFKHVNGFSSYPERDAAMTQASDVDVLILRQRGGAGSGTAANMYRRAFGSELAKEIINLIRENSMPYV